MTWRRGLAAVLMAAAVVALACAGMLVTTADAALSLLIEPFSLLLTPGAAVGLLVGGLRRQDLSESVVVTVNLAFYAALFLLLYARRKRMAATR